MPIIHFINSKTQTAGGMKNVLAYVTRAEKTQSEDKQYVTALNCSAPTAYEEMIATKNTYHKNSGRITPERYDTMASGYELEQAELRQELQCITQKIDEMDLREMYVKEFIAKAKTYIEMPAPTPELLRVFIRRIEVYEKTEKFSRTCGNRIVIHYTFQAGNGQRTDAVTDEASEMVLLPA